MKQNLLNKLWLRVCLIAAIMTTAFSGAVSAEEVTFDFPAIASANSWENGVAYTSYTISPITVEAQGGGNNGKYYTSSNGSWRMYSGGTVRISAEEGYTVTNVVSTPTCTFTIADGVATFSPTARTDFKTITVTYVAAGVTPSVATPIIMGVENFLTSTEVSIACGTEGAAILYNTGGDTWETYSEPFTLTETTTIQAKATKSGMNDSDVATKTFTKTVPYTVAEARAAIDAGTGTQGVYATGIVSAIPTAYSADYKNITFNFVDAEGDADFLQAYRCTGADAPDVQVGDVVVVYGNLTKYGSTYEFAQGCELVSLTHPAVALAAPVFSPEAGIYTSALRVVIRSEVSDAIIYYTTDGTEPTTESTQYEGAIPVSTTTTIKAIAVKGTDVSPVATATYAILAHEGTEADPYTVADARAAIDANAGLTDVYATGIVTEIPTAWSTEYSNITFNFVDAEGDADFLQAYRCVSTDAADASTVAVGDVVVVKGTLKKYGTTYEFGQGCQLISLTHPAVPDPVIVAENATIAADVTYYELMYSIENPIDGAELTATTTAAWITSLTPSTKSFDRVMIECEANDGAERTANIVLSYGGVSKEVTLTQEAYVAPVEEEYAELPFSFDGVKADIETTAGLTQEGLGTDYKNAPHLKFDGTGDFIVLAFDERPGVLSFDIQGNSFSGGTFKVQVSEDGEEYGTIVTYTELGTAETKTIRDLGEDVRYIKWIYSEKVTGNVGLGNINLEKYSDIVPESYTLAIANPENVTITANYGGETLLQNGENAQVTEGTEVTLALSIAEGYELESLTVKGAEEGQDVTLSPGTTETVFSFSMPAYDVTVNATVVEQETPPTPGTENWIEVALDEITADDVFVIVGDNGDTFAMYNDKGAASAPAAVAVTVEGDKITSAVADNIKWTVKDESLGYVFYPYGSAETWLYCMNSNNGVRVGTGDAKHFMLDGGYLTTTETTDQRYVGIYNSHDWRCYKLASDGSIQANIAGQTFKFYKKVSDVVVPTEQTLIVSEVGYATMVAEENLEIPADASVEVFAVKVNGDYASLLPITQGIPAGEPVIVKADAGEYSFAYTTSEVPDVPVNDLVPATDNVTADGTQYVLADGVDGIGFYRVIDGSTIPAGKAYLVIRSDGEGVKDFVGFEDDATGISKVDATLNAADAIYNVAGQRLSKMQRGINIVGNKKVVIK